MRIIPLASGLLLALSAPVLAQQPAPLEHPGPRVGGPAVDGSVVRTTGCGSYFFIVYHSEYALAQWVGGEMVQENDVLEGRGDLVSFEREGPMTFTNLSTGRTIDVVIEKALLNTSQLPQVEGQFCH